jgi:hypothetical protein
MNLINYTFSLEFYSTYNTMASIFQNTPKVTNVATATTGDVIEDDGKSDKLSDGASFTLVSNGRKPRATPKLAYMAVTKAKYGAFHQAIFPVVEKIIHEQKTLDTHFARQWKALRTSNKIGPNTSYRNLQKVLRFDSLKDFRVMLESLPGMKNHVMFREDRLNPEGFYYAICEENQEKSEDQQHDKLQDLPQDNPVSVTDPTLVTPVLDKTTFNPNPKDFEPDEDTIASAPHAKKICYGGDNDIKEMLSILWPYIQDYIGKHGDTSHAKQWISWIDNGLSIKSPLTQVKAIMGIETVAQLYLILRYSPAINPHYDITWDHKIEYQLKPLNAENEEKAVAKSETSTSGHLGDTVKLEQDNILKVTYKVRELTNNDEEFKVFHKLIYDAIAGWAAKQETHQHPLWMQWTKWVFSGLQPIMSAQRIKQIMGVQTLFQYVELIMTFPPIQQTFTVTINSTNIIYSHVPIYRIAADHNFLDFQHFTERFHIKTTEIARQLLDIEMKTDACANTQKHQFANMRQITEQTTTSIVNSSIASVKLTIENMIAEKLKRFEENLDHMVDDLIQEVYASSEEGHRAMLQAHENMLIEVEQQLQQKRLAFEKQIQDSMPKLQPLEPSSVPKPHSPPYHQAARFSHINIDHNFKKSANPYDTSSIPDTNMRRSPPTLHSYSGINLRRSPTFNNVAAVNKPVPETVHIDSNTNHVTTQDHLPPVNHDHAIKRTRVQFTGLGDMFVFYNHLLNSMDQFGIYLMPLKKVEYQKSLCPTEVHGFIITPWRKQAMASTLYQKLQHTDVIPLEYTAIRNILNRFAEVNDGYEVLYAMLELVHPKLQKDAVILPPKSDECDEDIHLYYQKFDAWIRYEAYANRPYSDREQVNHFIRGLSSHFACAVDRIRRLLDTWNPEDTTVPIALKITSLPNTIERYMMEATGNSMPHIRKTVATKTNRHGGTGPSPSRKQNNLDKYCFFCGAHGHVTKTCEFMAKFITATDNITKLDVKSKKELQEHFKAVQKEKRAKMLARKTSTIRKLIDTGGTEAEIESALAGLVCEDVSDVEDVEIGGTLAAADDASDST